MLCSSSRILSKPIQTIESGTPSVQESCSCTWEYVQVEEASKDVSSSREFSSERLDVHNYIDRYGGRWITL
jgi:hypothetical protein